MFYYSTMRQPQSMASRDKLKLRLLYHDVMSVCRKLLRFFSFLLLKLLLLYRVFIMELHYMLCMYYVVILCAVFVFQCATDISMLCSPHTHRRLPSNRRRRRDDRPLLLAAGAVLVLQTACFKVYAPAHCEHCCGGRDFSMHISAGRRRQHGQRLIWAVTTAAAAPRLRFPNQTRRL